MVFAKIPLSLFTVVAPYCHVPPTLRELQDEIVCLLFFQLVKCVDMHREHDLSFESSAFESRLLF